MPLVEAGHMNPGRWRPIAEVYAGVGLLKRDFNLKGFLYDPNPPPPDLTWLYGTLAAVVALLLIASLVAFCFARLSAALARSTAERLEQQARLLAVEEERKRLRQQQRLLRDLHDGLGAISANVNLLAARGLKEPAAARRG